MIPSKCPYCGHKEFDAEFVDIGVGFQQVTPAICENCGAQELHPFDLEKYDELPEETKKTGFFPSDYNYDRANI